MASSLASASLLAAQPACSQRLAAKRTFGLRTHARMLQQKQGRSHVVAVRAASQEPEGSAGNGVVQGLTKTASAMFARYDFLSAGMGALLVTGFCVSRGQDPGTALWITAAATVVALLVNDVLPEEWK